MTEAKQQMGLKTLRMTSMPYSAHDMRLQHDATGVCNQNNVKPQCTLSRNTQVFTVFLPAAASGPSCTATEISQIPAAMHCQTASQKHVPAGVAAAAAAHAEGECCPVLGQQTVPERSCLSAGHEQQQTGHLGLQAAGALKAVESTPASPAGSSKPAEVATLWQQGVAEALLMPAAQG